MHKKLTSIWVTAITLIAMLLSSVSFAAPSIPLLDSSTNMMMSANNHDEALCQHLMSVSEQHSSDTLMDECCDSDGSISEHKCCPVSNFINYSVLSQSLILPLQSSSLLLIVRDAFSNISSLTSSPYRPPIT
ncbi:hypothetical protein [Vibrio sp. HN007]|uniref:hypothetical protein n=1 Tax=Vibrio iocasae TaxID=3098914 RepID=UPI0035D42CF6